MAKREVRERSVYLPWERRGSLLRRSGFDRVRPFAIALATIAFMLLLGARDRRKMGIRSTRATLAVVRQGLDAFRADHQGACPGALGDLTRQGYLTMEPVDAWGRPLRLACPGRENAQGYDLSSDGPDGVPLGLDRIE